VRRSLLADAARFWLAVVMAMAVGGWMPSLSHAGVPPVVWGAPTDAGGARRTLLVLHGGC